MDRVVDVAFQPLESRVLMAATPPAFKLISLVSDTTAIKANHHDKHLINAWGLAAGPGTEWWVANNGTGTSTLYDGTGAADSLVVTVPGFDGKPTVVTGEVYHGSTMFQV